MIRFACPNCDRHLIAPDEAAGHRTKCRSCRTIIPVPGLRSVPKPRLDSEGDSTEELEVELVTAA